MLAIDKSIKSLVLLIAFREKALTHAIKKGEYKGEGRIDTTLLDLQSLENKKEMINIRESDKKTTQTLGGVAEERDRNQEAVMRFCERNSFPTEEGL